MSAKAGHQEGLDSLIEQADAGMESALRRIKALLPDEEKESWELEREAFGVKPVPPEEPPQGPVVDRPTRASWRDLFRRRWPEGPRKTRRPRR